MFGLPEHVGDHLFNMFGGKKSSIILSVSVLIKFSDDLKKCVAKKTVHGRKGI